MINRLIKISLILTLALFSVILSGCDSDTSEKAVKKTIPAVFTEYSLFDYEKQAYDDYKLKVDEVNVIEKEELEEYDHLKCEITFKNKYIEKKSYVELDYIKDEKGKWTLGCWELYREDEITALKFPDEEYLSLAGILNDAGFDKNVKTKNAKANEAGGFTLDVPVDSKYKYVKYSGDLICHFAIVRNSEMSEGDDRILYLWNTELDTRKLKTSWNIDKTWEVEQLDSDNPDKMSITVSTGDSSIESMTASGTRYTSNGMIYELMYKDVKEEEDALPCDAELKFTLIDSGSNKVYVTFGTDSMKVSMKGYYGGAYKFGEK